MSGRRWDGWSSGGSGGDAEQDRWATPPEVFRPLDAEFGFGLDAAARASNTKVPDNWFGPDHPDPLRRNGLNSSWALACGGRPVWVNPPYSDAGTFLQVARVMALSGVTTAALVFARTDTWWWWKSVLGRDPRTGYRLGGLCAAEIRWRPGRITFLDPLSGGPRLDSNGRPASAPAPSVLIVYRPGYREEWPENKVMAR